MTNYYDINDSATTGILLKETLYAFIICCIITCIYMYNNNDSIICNDYYCYAHKHSYVCYLGWCSFNGLVGTAIWDFIVGIFGYPILYNTQIFIHNCYCDIYNKFLGKKVKTKKNTNLMKEFLNYKEKHV